MVIYRFLLGLAGPLVLAVFAMRVMRRRETWADFAQRLGRGSGQGPAIWVHGASNGELTSAKTLIQAVQTAHPTTPVVITCNTVTARDMVQN